MDESFLALRNALRGRYDLDRLVGRGGMANVYLATDLRHGRPVAVKVLRANFGDAADSARFAREIETAARLQHPNILPVYDSGEALGAAFFVMPYVEGDTLRQRLERERTIPWLAARQILREIGDALAFAHSRNVIHRDVKPENILFFAGHAVVADFGIARVLRAAGNRLTLEGHGVGTPEYMSPEQAFGESHVDARTDVYGLACVAFEMLSGEPPWSDASPLAILLRKNHEDPPALAINDDATPPHIPAVLQRALARDPALRYADITAMLADLEASGFSTGLAMQVASAQAAPIASTPSVAVLPFANLGGDASDEYLSDGLSEELIHALSQAGGLHVVARTSSFRYKGRSVDVREIGKELQVVSVLEGSLRRHGNRLRITARLIDAKSGFERWSERYEREFTDVFDMLDDIARSIVASLEGTLRPTERAVVASTNDMQAYELFLEGRFYWNQRSASSLRRSVSLLERAVARDPSFAAAHAALAEACVTIAVYGVEAPAEYMRRARVAAERSLVLRPGYTDALVARASVSALNDWAVNAAEADFSAATSSPQTTATAFQSFAMNLLVPQRRFREAHEMLLRARELDPLSPVVASSIGVALLSEGNAKGAIRAFYDVLEREPQFGIAHFFLARALDAHGDEAGALDALTRGEPVLGDSVEATAFRGVVLANAGRTVEARAVLEELDRRATPWDAGGATVAGAGARYISQVLRAEISAALGDTDGAVQRLQQAADARAADLVWIAVRPAFRRLRPDVRFRYLAGRIGIRAAAERSGEWGSVGGLSPSGSSEERAGGDASSA